MIRICLLSLSLLLGLSNYSFCQKDAGKKINSLSWIIIAFFLFGNSYSIFAQNHFPGQHRNKLAIKETVVMKALAFDLADVKLLNSRFTQNMERESNWILSLEVARLLHTFRTNAGIWSGFQGGYETVDRLGGWESLDCELRGHTTGHILSGLALLYASTGDNIYKTKADSLVSGLAEVQSILNQGGYLSAFPQNLVDRAIDGKPVWAPWYTLHKLFAGLTDQYLYCNNGQALEIVKKMADWSYNKLSALTPEQRKVMLGNEFGGMNDAFYMLYEITGNDKYKWLGEFFYHEANLDPLKLGEDNLEDKHANTLIPKLTGLARGYELGESKQYKEISDFFWNTVIDHHTYCTDSNSDAEQFFKPDHQSQHLTGMTGESCNVYNMLKLTRHLFCMDADSKFADYYEKALYNHILGQQDTKTGMIAYYLPLLPGAFKVYSTPDSSFWCCVGSAFENQAKFGEAIYYHKDDQLFVNLFIPSELNWREQNVMVTQETKFPEEGKSKLIFKINTPKKFILKLRYPSWAKAGAFININGKKIKVRQQPGSYISIERTWKDGDQVGIEYPMELEVQPSDNPDIVSISYGPVVLAAKMGTHGMENPAPYSNPNVPMDFYYDYNYRIPANLSNVLNFKGKPIKDWLKPVQGKPLTFTIADTTSEEKITLAPLYDIHRERYIVYWNLKNIVP